MHLYTKGGDAGETSLLGGERVRKDSLRTETYGTVDELGSWLGLVAAELGENMLAAELGGIQGRLLEVGARLASTEMTAEAYGLKPPGEPETAVLEQAIELVAIRYQGVAKIKNVPERLLYAANTPANGNGTTKLSF